MRTTSLFVTWLLTLCLVAGCLFGCTTAPEQEEEIDLSQVELPDYSADTDSKSLTLGAYWMPYLSEEAYGQMAEVGFNYIFLDNQYSIAHGSERIYRALEYAEKFDMKATIIFGKDWAKDTNDYSDYPAFDGYYEDEPEPGELDELAEVALAFNEAHPDKLFNINLYPSCEQTGGTIESYEQYVQDYVDKIMNKMNVRQICFDRYPLLYADGVGAYVAPDWLSVIEVVAKAAAENDVDFNSFIATMSLFGGKNRRPAEEDIRYQCYVNLAYGVTGIHSFCYKTPGAPPFESNTFQEPDYAMLNHKGEKTEIYDAAKTVFAELKSFDHVYLNYDWEGVITLSGDQEEAENLCFERVRYSLNEHEGICSAAASRDTLIGCFKDAEEGLNGYMLVNFTDPYYGSDDIVSVEFENADCALVYEGGEGNLVALKNGVYTATLKPGEGRFVIPLHS